MNSGESNPHDQPWGSDEPAPPPPSGGPSEYHADDHDGRQPPVRRSSSGWKWVLILGGVGFLGLLCCGGGVLAFVLIGLNQRGTRIALKGGSELYYTKTVPEAEAKKLAEFIDKDEKTLGNPTLRGSYQINKEGNTYQFRVVVKDDANLNDGSTKLYFQLLAIMISQEVFNGAPVDIHFCDQSLKTKSTLEFIGKKTTK